MPQGRAVLRGEFGDDATAWNFLKALGFTEYRFIIRVPVGRTLTKKENDAIEFLVTEYDWEVEW